MKKIWYGVLFTMMIMTFVSCGANGKEEKYIVEGKKAMTNEEYEKAKNWFELGVKEEKNDEKYSELLKIAETLIKLEEMNKNSNFEGFESSVAEINKLEALEEYRKTFDKLVEKTKNNKKEFEKGKVNNDKVGKDKVVSNKVDKDRVKDKVVSNKVDKDKNKVNKDKVKEPNMDKIKEANKELFKGLESVKKNQHGVKVNALELDLVETKEYLNLKYTIYYIEKGVGENGESIKTENITQEMVNKGKVSEVKNEFEGSISYESPNKWTGYINSGNKVHNIEIKKISEGKYEMVMNGDGSNGIFTVKGSS